MNNHYTENIIFEKMTRVPNSYRDYIISLRAYNEYR